MEPNDGPEPRDRVVPGTQEYVFWWHYKGVTSIRLKPVSPDNVFGIAAHHEAAHAVVAIRLGMKVNAVRLEQSAGGIKGHALVELVHQGATPDTYRSLAVVLAGGLIHRRFNPTLAAKGTAGDESQIAKILRDCFPGSPRAQQSARMRATEIAEGIIQRDWKFISALADALMAWRLIERNYLMKIAARFPSIRGLSGSEKP